MDILEVYDAEGWRGSNRDKLKPRAEMQRAHTHVSSWLLACPWQISASPFLALTHYNAALSWLSARQAGVLLSRHGFKPCACKATRNCITMLLRKSLMCP